VLAASPLDALRTAAYQPPHVARFGRSAGVGAATIVAATALWLGRTWWAFDAARAGLIAMLGGVVGTACAVPGLVAGAVRLGDRIARGRSAVVPFLALRGIAADLRPTALTASALLVSSGADPFAPEAVRMPQTLADRLAAVAGVAYVAPIRTDRLAFEGSRIAVVATDAALYRDGRRQLAMVAGDGGRAAEALASGDAVVVNQTFASRFHRRIGDRIVLPTPAGPLALRIAGIHLELTPGDLGTIRMDIGRYRRAWRDSSVTLIEVTLAPHADPAAVAARIRRAFGAQHQLIVLTAEGLRAEYAAMLGRLNRLVSPLLIVAIGSGLVGVTSARVATMLARRRLVGLLRAVGIRRRQLAAVYACEGALVALTAAGLAAVVGSGLGWTQVVILLRGMLGMSVVYHYPAVVALGGGLAVVAVTAAIGWTLGRRAARVPIREALQAP
jgi:putative ABC transport system permease protein